MVCWFVDIGRKKASLSWASLERYRLVAIALGVVDARIRIRAVVVGGGGA